MESVDQFIHAKWVIPCEEKMEVLEDHTVAVKNGKIHEILPIEFAVQKYATLGEQYFTTHALLPGFINSHTHLAMNVFRGFADDLPLMDWLNDYIWPAEKKWVGHKMVFDGSILAISEMIRSGITCFNDMYFYPNATAKAAEEAGIRAHVGITIIDVPTAWAKSPEEYFAKGLDFYEEYKHHPLVTPTMAPHSTYTVSLENLIKVNELAKQHRMKINIHLQEAASEIAQSLATYGKRPLERLHEIGMLTSDLIAIHMTQITPEDFALIEQTGIHIVHCPESNMKLASGACPVDQLFKHHVNVALGTDGAASNNDLDMIGEMRSAAFLGKLTANDPKAVSAETVLKMATINGAKALGIDHITGSLTPGKAADCVAIDLKQLEMQPLYHPLSQVVYAASRQQVTDVWVAGKQLLKNREFLTLDERRLRTKVQDWQKKVSGNY